MSLEKLSFQLLSLLTNFRTAYSENLASVTEIEGRLEEIPYCVASNVAVRWYVEWGV